MRLDVNILTLILKSRHVLIVNIFESGSEWLVMMGAIGVGVTCYGIQMTSCHVSSNEPVIHFGEGGLQNGKWGVKFYPYTKGGPEMFQPC